VSLTATYDPVLSRVRLAGTVLGAGATYAFVWRSTDNFVTSSVVRGAIFAPMSGGVFNVDDYEFPPGVPVRYQIASYNGANVQQASFTTVAATFNVTQPWLKSMSRPFLNTAVKVQDVSDIVAPARSQVYRVVGRSAGIAVSDVRAGREFTIVVPTEDIASEQRIRYLVAAGDPLYLQMPSGLEESLIPTGYYEVGNVARELAMRRNPRRYWTLPLTEVVAPGPDIVGATVTWATVIATYASWNAVMTAKATWQDVLQLIAAPSEVIVP
jgi:hypothetical protein